MTLLAVPNVSEGRDRTLIDACVEGVTEQGARVLDLHVDPRHNRSVLTLTAPLPTLIDACVRLAELTDAIDLEVHEGVHPRLGALDVCPFVPHHAPMQDAVHAAREAGRRMATELGRTVYLYGDAARRAATRELPDLRRGGLRGLAERARAGYLPDEGSGEIDMNRGVVCVGARGPLIAFNVWLRAPVTVARRVAGEVRGPALRALGLEMDDAASQVSMNLIDPEDTGIQEAFARVVTVAARLGAAVVHTEIVGLVEERFLPPVNAQVTRLLIEPGHSVEAALKASS